MPSKYIPSSSPTLDKSFEHLPVHVQEGISASGISMHGFLILYVDDRVQIPEESFVQWLAGHFQLTPTGVDDFDTRALRDVLIPEYRTPADILALQTNPPWPGEMSEERLVSLMATGIPVGATVLVQPRLRD